MAEIENSSTKNPRVTWEGCSVLLDINDGDRLVFARLSPGATLKIGKSNLSLRPLIGCPFGSLFRVENGQPGPHLSRVLQSEEGKCDQENGDDVKKEMKDNRAIVDNNTAQTLTGEDIDTMRRQGAAGDVIVEALIANSATFDKKTAFSQEKYKLRKQKKYAPKVLLRRPFARSICEAYFKKHPARIGFLRLDAMSLLLSMANPTAYSDILVVDMVGGLITGALAERLGGSGYVCNIHLGDTSYPMDIVRIFNFSDEICNRIVRCCVSNLCSAQKGTCEQLDQTADECDKAEGPKEHLSSCDSPNHSISMEEDIPSAEIGQSGAILDNGDSCVAKIKKSIKAGEKASEELIKSWKERGFSSLVIAATELDVWSIMQKLLPLLSYSASFAVYHQYLQPLATCMHNLQIERMAIGLQISEPWLREYQVLPSRTHPCMQMSAFGGYILSGTKIRTIEPNNLNNAEDSNN